MRRCIRLGEGGASVGVVRRVCQVLLAVCIFALAVVVVQTVKAPAAEAQVPDPCNYVPGPAMLGDARMALAAGGTGLAASLETVGLTGALGSGSALGALAPVAALPVAGFTLGVGGAVAAVVAAAIGTCAWVDWMSGSEAATTAPTPPGPTFDLSIGSRTISWPSLPRWCVATMGPATEVLSIQNDGSVKFRGTISTSDAEQNYRTGLHIGGANCEFDPTVGATVESSNGPSPGQGGVMGPPGYGWGFLSWLGQNGYARGQSGGPRLASAITPTDSWLPNIGGLMGPSFNVIAGGYCDRGVSGPGCFGVLTTTYTRTATGYAARFRSTAGGDFTHNPEYVLPGPLSDLRYYPSVDERGDELASFFAWASEVVVRPTGFRSIEPAAIVNPVLVGETDCADSAGSVATRTVQNVGSPKSLRLPVAACLTGEMPVAVRQLVKPTSGTGAVATVLDWKAPTGWVNPSTRPAYAPCLVRGNSCGVPATVSGSCVWGGVTVPANLCVPQSAGGRSTSPTYPSGTSAVSLGLTTTGVTTPTTVPGGTPTTVPGSTTNNVTVNFPDAVKIDPGDAPVAQAGGEPCRPSGWGRFNPVSWVAEPAKCAIKWAFVPSPADLSAALDGLNTASNGPPFRYVRDGVAALSSSSFGFCEWRSCAGAAVAVGGQTIDPKTMFNPAESSVPLWPVTVFLGFMWLGIALAVLRWL